MTLNNNRNLGLDVLRSIAILSVVFHHSLFLLMKDLPSSKIIHLFIAIGPYGSLGVDLFFSLSGFLIGGILIKAFATNRFNKVSELWTFWMRRWLRTLPNYYFMLLVHVVIVLLLGKELLFDWSYLYFGQNIINDPPDFFMESWSLAIEEWFYFTFPILLFLAGLSFKKIEAKHLILGSIIGYILLFTLLRFQADVDAIHNLNKEYKKIVIYRLDAIGYGLLAAYFFYFKKDLFQRYKNMALVIALLFLGWIGYATHKNITGHESAFIFSFNRYFHLTISAIGFTCLIPYFYFMNQKGRSFALTAGFFSAISYSLYLLNIPVYELLDELEMNLTLKYIVYWILCVFFSWLVYKFLEQPVLKLRDKKYVG